jgi:hypothetical protein
MQFRLPPTKLVQVTSAPPLITDGGPAVHDVAVTLYVQLVVAEIPFTEQPVNAPVPVDATHVTPTNGDDPIVPTNVDVVHVRVVPVTPSVVTPPVAVYVVSPLFSHVTAPALAANDDNISATSTPSRAILHMTTS